MTDPADSSTHPVWDFDYHYDTSLGDFYSHHDGNGDEICSVTLFADGEACNVLNLLEDGRAYVFSPSTAAAAASEDPKCCIYPSHLGMIKSDWLLNTNATFVSVEVINDVEAAVWQAEGQFTNYYAADLSGGDRPVRFWEHKGELLKQWDFDQATYKVAEQDDAPDTVFTPPKCRSICVPR